ncbi:MAG: alpha/beta hydrolase [Bdellovibrionales bacterium]|nr:alpha/beta hydrolase [Bdellovibrionales bacterium]
MSKIKPIPVVKGSFKSFDKTSIYYEVRGSGEPIIFIYGIGCLMNHFVYQTSILSQNYKVINIDLRGHGSTAVPKLKKNISISAIAKDIPLLLKKLKIKKAHFVGHSFGCSILLEAYKQKCEIFKSLSLINGFSSNPLDGMFYSEKIIQDIYRYINILSKNLPESFSFIWENLLDNPISPYVLSFLGGFNPREVKKKDIEIYIQGIAYINQSVFFKLFNEMINADYSNLLAKIKTPTMIIAGKRDPLTPVEKQKKLSKNIKNSTLFIFEEGSHCTQLDFPEELSDILQKFIKKSL